MSTPHSPPCSPLLLPSPCSPMQLPLPLSRRSRAQPRADPEPAKKVDTDDEYLAACLQAECLRDSLDDFLEVDKFREVEPYERGISPPADDFCTFFPLCTDNFPTLYAQSLATMHEHLAALSLSTLRQLTSAFVLRRWPARTKAFSYRKGVPVPGWPRGVPYTSPHRLEHPHCTLLLISCLLNDSASDHELHDVVKGAVPSHVWDAVLAIRTELLMFNI